MEMIILRQILVKTWFFQEFLATLKYHVLTNGKNHKSAICVSVTDIR